MSVQKIYLEFYTVNDNSEIVRLNVNPDQKSLALEKTSQGYNWDMVFLKIKQVAGAAFEYSPCPDEQAERIQILLVKTAHLKENKFFFELAGPVIQSNEEGKLTRTHLRHTHDPASNEPFTHRFFPVLTIGYPDLMRIFEEAPGLDFELNTADNYWKSKREESGSIYKLQVSPYIKFLDSSIWHRYVPYNNNFEASFRKVLSDISTYIEQRLYVSISALATLEFQCRMLKNSLIANYGDRGHHFAVTPFKFHSETIMEQKVAEFAKFFEECYKGINERIKWHVLLVDDYVEESISVIEKSDQSIKPPTKKAIIENLLNTLFHASTSSSPKKGTQTTPNRDIIIHKCTNDPMKYLTSSFLITSLETVRRSITTRLMAMNFCWN
jgi:hypothetical protein